MRISLPHSNPDHSPTYEENAQPRPIKRTLNQEINYSLSQLKMHHYHFLQVLHDHEGAGTLLASRLLYNSSSCSFNRLVRKLCLLPPPGHEKGFGRPLVMLVYSRCW
jgi:hypothetical protein